MSLYYSIKKQLFPTKEGNPIPSFTPQFRLEARSRTSGGDSTSLAMRVADPLWMLGRQWQFGEFQAEDNGSPISIDTFYTKEQTKYYALGSNGTRQELNNIPLEAKVEAMNVAPNPTQLDLKTKVRIGQRFERMVRKNNTLAPVAEQLIVNMREINPLTSNPVVKLDAASQRFFNLMSGKVIDGSALIGSFKYPNLSGRTFDDVLKGMIQKVLVWYKDFYVQPTQESAWNQHQLAHQFKLQGDNTTLNAPDYQSGHLDWYSFDTAETKIQALSTKPTEMNLLPLNVSFSSMPNKRLYAFEDSKIDLSKMDIESGELIKTMLIDFSLVSGSDWFTIPLKMKLGELCWVEKIEVKDVFGVKTKIVNDEITGAILNPDGLQVWDMFKIRNTNPANYVRKDHFLFLAPAATMRLESEPLEELLFLRDEYANMVWAVERKAMNGMGKAVDGFDLHLEISGSPLDPAPPKNDSLPQFRLASTVPSNWIPYLPQHIANNNKNIELKRALMMRNEKDKAPRDIPPLTQLAANDIQKVREEAIPRAGVRVQVTNQRVRWTDGKTYLWRGRKVLAGRGEGNSGLRFDYLKE